MEKIAFPKRLWWSITKISKYDEMIKQGLKKSIKYFVGIVAIMALILALIGSYIQAEHIQEIGKYVDENIPEFKIENIAEEGEENNYKLSLENNEVIILDNEDFINAFNSTIVVNTNLDENEAINEYYVLATEKNYSIVCLEDKCIMISSDYNPENENQEEGITKYTYEEVLTNYIGTDATEFNKDNLLGVFNNNSYIYYIVMYFVYYFIILVILYALDIVVLGVIASIFAKAFKNEMNRKRIFSLSIYSSTLSIIIYIVYLIINYFAKFNFSYINLINMLISIVYVIVYFYKNKKKEAE